MCVRNNFRHPLHHRRIRRPQRHPLQIPHHHPSKCPAHPRIALILPLHHRNRRMILPLPQIQPHEISSAHRLNSLNQTNSPCSLCRLCELCENNPYTINESEVPPNALTGHIVDPHTGSTAPSAPACSNRSTNPPSPTNEPNAKSPTNASTPSRPST